MASLAKCLRSLPDLFTALGTFPQHQLIAPELLSLKEFAAEQAAYLESAILPDPEPHLREGGVIAKGFDAELDRLRELGENSTGWLARYQAELIQETSIPTLKIGFNKVFGYYIEVTDAHRDKIPAAWSRKQTVKNAERYITEKLKEFENEALSARDKAIVLEQRLFEQIRQTLLPVVAGFQELADGLARLDVLCCPGGLRAGNAVTAARR
ncbi:MAG: hypothetical protein QM753_07610 [Thermomicrobiales bacterium]